MASSEAPVIQVRQQWPPATNEEVGLPEGLALNYPAIFLHNALDTPSYVPALVSCNVPAASCSYGNLLSHVVRLAVSLRRDQGVADGKPVAVLMEKSPRYVVALLATLLAGGSFVPLSPSDPPSLLARVVADCGIACAVVGPGCSMPPGATILRMEEQLETLTPLTEVEISEARGMAAAISPEQQACVVYSSGTTGNPKGICIPHRAMVACYLWRFSVTRPKRWGGSRVACNVFFVWECLRPFLRGATCVVIPDEVIFDPTRLLEALYENRVSEWLSTPSLFESVLQIAPPDELAKSLRTLRVLLFNGEVVRPTLARRTLKALRSGGNVKARVYNLYSISECHEVTILELTDRLLDSLPSDAAAVPVGHVAPFVNALVIDQEDCEGDRDAKTAVRVLPYGEVGRLHVGGPGLAICYHGNAPLTAERFPTLPNLGRVYDTGDLVRIVPATGPEAALGPMLHVLGRGDSMVKIRGYSVVLGAIEAMINRALGVQQCAVVAEGAEGTDKRLVAYLVLDSETLKNDWPIDERTGACPTAYAALKHHLPFAHVPACYVALDSLPVHAVSGKTNLKALPAPPARVETVADLSTSASDVAVLMENRPTLAGIIVLFAEVIGVSSDSVTEHDDFFALGGHSLLAAALVSRVKRCEWSLALRVADIFQHPTPASLLEFLTDDQPTTPRDKKAPVISKAAQEAQVRQGQEQSRKDLAADKLAVDAIFAAAPAAPALTTPITALPADSAVLVTGSTGFVGAAVAEELRASCPAVHIIQLVRSKKGCVVIGQTSRSRLLVGDLSKPLFGLTEEEFSALREEVDAVVHCAAAVNLVAKYSTLRRVNVNGTIELIRLGKPLRFVSSSAAHPEARDGYGISKYVAEQLVVHARTQHNLDATFIRPADIAGPGALHDHRFITLRAVLESGGRAPPLPGWRWRAVGIEDVVSCLLEGKEELPAPYVCDISQIGVWLRDAGYNFTLQKAEEGKEEAAVAQWAQSLPEGSPVRVFADREHLLPLCQAEDPHEEENAPSVPYPRQRFMRELLHERAKSDVPFPKPLPLMGHCAIVTGASSGIGAAIVRRLLQAGARVLLTSRRGIAPQAAVMDFKQGRDYAVASCDVRSAAQVQHAVDECARVLGAPSVVVNNAGVMYFTLMKNLRLNEWQQTVDTVCSGTCNLVRAALPYLLARGSNAHFLSITSDAGKKPFAGLAVYSGAKFFVEAMTHAMREEFAVDEAAQHIRICNVQPGNVSTPLLGMSSDKEALAAYGTPTPNCKVLDPDDVARTVVHVLSQPEHCAINEVLIEPRMEPI